MLYEVITIFSHPSAIVPAFKTIFADAFTGNAVLGGSLGAIIITGVRRAAFSNEAGLGTAPMAHGAAKTNEPIREGLVAMLGPIIDTIVVCTMTALAIIVTNTWVDTSSRITSYNVCYTKLLRDRKCMTVATAMLIMY